MVLREREFQAVAPEAEVQVYSDAQNRALRIVDQFKVKYLDQPRVRYNNLFEVIKAQPEWFLKALRK